MSLKSAATVKTSNGQRILGYHILSDSNTGDYWVDGGLTVNEFLADIKAMTGTAPEVVSAWVPGQKRSNSSGQAASRTVLEATPLGADLPEFDAPDAVVTPALLPRYGAPEQSAQSRISAMSASGASEWAPTSAEAMIRDQGSNVSITAKYSWYGTNPFAAPYNMAEHWGMEFQFDFYTRNKGVYGDENRPNYGQRPFCGTGAGDDSYKDWASASNRPFNWFATVVDGTSTIVAPRQLGFYGDYNDLSDPCNVSSVTVGVAAPWRIPSTIAGTQEVMVQMYPQRGLDTQSTVGSIVQPVSRGWCETYPFMPLTDCMGVLTDGYPGPGITTNRPVLGDQRGWKAPDLCWVSQNYGRNSSDTFSWDCNSGE